MNDNNHEILLVDDSRFILHRVGNQIRKKHSLITASSAEEALTILAQEKIGIVIADVVMPGMSGLDLLEICNKKYPMTRVIIITSENTSTNILFSLQHRAFSYIPKPINQKTLMVTIEAALQSSKSSIQVLGAHKDWVSVELPNDLTLIKGKLNFFYGLYSEFFSKPIAEQVQLAFDEMVMNAWEHGNKKNPDAKIFIELIRFKKFLMYRIKDEGAGFHLAGMRHAAVNNPEEDALAHLDVREELGIRDGGLGILMTKNIVDEMKYSDKGNELVLIKYLDSYEE